MIRVVNHPRNSNQGFFSKFLTCLDWIQHSIETGQDIFIDWSRNDNNNLWEILFNQIPTYKNDIVNQDIVFNLRVPREGTLSYYLNKPQPFYPENYSELKKIRDIYNNVWNLLTINDKINSEIERDFDKVTKNTLGVTVRAPVHYGISYTDFYLNIINEIKLEFSSGNYDRIFVACDVEFFMSLIKEHFDEKLISHIEYTRVQEPNGDWKLKKLNEIDEYKLILKDSILLSRCKKVMGGSSNIFFGVLIINNNIEYKLFDILKNSYGL